MTWRGIATPAGALAGGSSARDCDATGRFDFGAFAGAHLRLLVAALDVDVAALGANLGASARLDGGRKGGLVGTHAPVRRLDLDLAGREGGRHIRPGAAGA